MSSFLPKDFQGIQLTELQYKVGTYPLFHPLNATFPLGHIIAIVGPNGSGKSTLLRLLAGIRRPYSGEIRYLGTEKTTFNQHHFKQMLGYVPAVPALYPHLTVLENLRFVAALKKASHKNFLPQIQTILEQCALSDYQKVLFDKLSEGFKKRVVLASQLIHQPTILILDEPCAELDPLQRQQLWQLLAQLRQPERLIILSSHHPQEINTLCDEIYFLHQGKLEAIKSEQTFSQVFWQRASASTTKNSSGEQQA